MGISNSLLINYGHIISNSAFITINFPLSYSNTKYSLTANVSAYRYACTEHNSYDRTSSSVTLIVWVTENGSNAVKAYSYTTIGY